MQKVSWHIDFPSNRATLVGKNKAGEGISPFISQLYMFLITESDLIKQERIKAY